MDDSPPQSIPDDPAIERYEIVIRPLSGDPLGRPGHQCLRAMLKLALRGYHLKCESVRPLGESGLGGDR